MGFLDVAAIVLTMSALFAAFNYHYLRLPTTIGVMLISLVVSLLALSLRYFGLIDIHLATAMVAQINFSETLVDGMLGALLFAGALQINFKELKSRFGIILVLATFGVVVSTAIVGFLTYFLCQLLNIDISLLFCLAFGALISPTDPIAVLAILRKVGVSKILEMDVTGESLFNDGIGYVVFTLILSLALEDQSMGIKEGVFFFTQEAVGGILFGIVISYITYLIMKRINDYHIEILITIALVIGGYTLAERIHVSAPLAIVVAGIITGNLTRSAMQYTSNKYLSIFWEIIDELLNCILFVLLGIEILAVNWNIDYLYLGFFAIVIVLFGRLLSVAAPVLLMRRFIIFSPRAIRLLTWGGLRGGLSVAMALTIPAGDEKQLILIMTYACVIFAIFIQGTTIAKVAGNRTMHDDGRLVSQSDKPL